MSWTYKDFIERFKGSWDYPELKEEGKRYSGKLDKTKPRISESWTTGGMTGGSCWDTGESHHYPVSAEDEPALDGLDALLEEIAPAMTFLHYRKLEKLLETRDYSNMEYYGNYYDKREKFIDARKLYDFLVEFEYLKEAES